MIWHAVLHHPDDGFDPFHKVPSGKEHGTAVIQCKGSECEIIYKNQADLKATGSASCLLGHAMPRSLHGLALVVCRQGKRHNEGFSGRCSKAAVVGKAFSSGHRSIIYAISKGSRGWREHTIS